MGSQEETKATDQKQLSTAVELLRNGDVVAIPTETVYGLAASIEDENAIQKIFSTKKRPFFDPLIVHIASVEQAKRCVQEWSPLAELLADKFWPGPLTLILKKSGLILDTITSGLETVALRMPNHEIALETIRQLGSGVAAPSANVFGNTSPTTAQHVKDEFQQQVYVLEGGPCDVGIESTLLDISNGPNDMKVLRPGMVTPEQVLKACLESFPEASVSHALEGQQAPGQMENHYMPSQPLVVFSSVELGSKSDKELVAQVNEVLEKQYEGYTLLKLDADHLQAARELYAKMREASQEQGKFIIFEAAEYHLSEKWAPLRNRIARAMSYSFHENFTAEPINS